MKVELYEVLREARRIVMVDEEATIHVMDDQGVTVYNMPVFTRENHTLYVAPGQYKLEDNGQPSVDPNMIVEVLFAAPEIHVASDAL